jgi:hypothetical protein
VVAAGNANGTAASLAAAGGPDSVTEPGFVNVGRSSTGNASVTYLGNRWVLSAGHNSTGTSVSFGGVSYTIDGGTVTYLHNQDNSLADLKLFRIDSAPPGIPEITPALINTATPTGRQIMIGNGLSRGDPYFWTVDEVPDPWVWTEQPDPVTPGADDYAGFKILLARGIRWGEDEVVATGLFGTTFVDGTLGPLSVHAYATQFDHADYTGVTPLASEAIVSNGDSGGAVFQFVDGAWKLTGIMVSFADLYSGQPEEPADIPYAVYGNQSAIIDLSFYRDEILSIIVPEPAGFALAAGGFGLLVLARRRRGR